MKLVAKLLTVRNIIDKKVSEFDQNNWTTLSSRHFNKYRGIPGIYMHNNRYVYWNGKTRIIKQASRKKDKIYFLLDIYNLTNEQSQILKEIIMEERLKN